MACARINPLTIVIVFSDMAKEATSRKLVDLLKKELKCEKCESLGFASGGYEHVLGTQPKIFIVI